MLTPWGDLRSLDLSNRDLATAILCSEKHSLVEGLIVECLFDQILDCVPKNFSNVTRLPVETVVAKGSNSSAKPVAFVWAKEKTDGLGRYLVALQERFRVVLVEYQPSDGFVASPVSGGRREADPIALVKLVESLAGRAPTPFVVSESVRDQVRQLTAIWGFLSQHYDSRLPAEILLPRILINYGIQPWFRAVWNVDRIFLVDGHLWTFEVKHKFPFGRPLQFGLNNGEAWIAGQLERCGIRGIFSIMVKPVWSKDVGSMYILNDMSARDRTHVVGRVLDAESIDEIMNRQSLTSGAHTTITGSKGGELKFKPILASSFSKLGVLSDKPADIASKIVTLLRGELLANVSPGELQQARFERSDVRGT